jgi:hypothetical protein
MPLKVYAPVESVFVAIVVPTTITSAPAMGLPVFASVTLPETVVAVNIGLNPTLPIFVVVPATILMA